MGCLHYFWGSLIECLLVLPQFSSSAIHMSGDDQNNTRRARSSTIQFNSFIAKFKFSACCGHSKHLTLNFPPFCSLVLLCTSQAGLQDALAHATLRGAPSGPLLIHPKLCHSGVESTYSSSAYSKSKDSESWAPLSSTS